MDNGDLLNGTHASNKLAAISWFDKSITLLHINSPIPYDELVFVTMWHVDGIYEIPSSSNTLMRKERKRTSVLCTNLIRSIGQPPCTCMCLWVCGGFTTYFSVDGLIW